MQRLFHLAQVDSTQAFLRRHPELGHCAVLADSQTEGRGRQGKGWISEPAAGLWMSAALPSPDLQPGLILQRAMGAVAQCLDSPRVDLGLKWPNDLVAWKAGQLVKLGGIIGEKAGHRLILGLGLNLQSAPRLEGRAIPAASLAELGISFPPILNLARRILVAWSDLSVEGRPLFKWPEPGTPIEWEQGQGVVLGWEEDGRLKVTTSGGLVRLNAAEIRRLRAG